MVQVWGRAAQPCVRATGLDRAEQTKAVDERSPSLHAREERRQPELAVHLGRGVENKREKLTGALVTAKSQRVSWCTSSALDLSWTFHWASKRESSSSAQQV